MKTRIIALANNKGGVGKTTTTVNLAAGLAHYGRRVLILDADPQANASFALLGEKQPDHSLYDGLVLRTTPLAGLIRTTPTPGLDVIPSTINLSAADVVLAGVPGRERLLARLLRPVTGYDYVLIDSPPSLGVLTVNALTTASEIVIPVSVGTFALMGISLLEDTIAQLKENLELENLRITGAVATLAERTRVSQDTIGALRQHFGERLFQTVIPKNKDIEEAHSRSMSVLSYAPESRGAQAFRALTEEVTAGES